MTYAFTCEHNLLMLDGCFPMTRWAFYFWFFSFSAAVVSTKCHVYCLFVQFCSWECPSPDAAMLCNDTLCWLGQGQELEALRAATPYQHIVYCGDGANDLCPALALASTDTVLARKVSLLFLPHQRCGAALQRST